MPSGDGSSHSMNAGKTWTNLLERDAPKWMAKSIRRRAHPNGKPSDEIGHPATVNRGIVAPPHVLVKEGAHRTCRFLFRGFPRKCDAAKGSSLARVEALKGEIAMTPKVIGHRLFTDGHAR